MTHLFNFLKKPKPVPTAPANRAHPLEAIPIRSENVEQRRSDSGAVHLLGKFPNTGFFQRLVAGSERKVQIALDDNGTFFWSLINGHRNLFAISDRIQSRFKLGESESQEATVLFVKMLMRRGYIRLKFHPVTGGPNPEKDPKP